MLLLKPVTKKIKKLPRFNCDVNINNPKKQLELFGQPDHVRIYGKDYITRLQDAGFEVEVIDYAKSFDEATRFKYGLKASELIFLCRKTAG